MKVERIDHLHGYCKDVEALARLFSDLFEMKTTISEYPDTYGTKTCVMRPKGSYRFMEWVQPTDPNGPLAKVIGAREEGILIVNFKVPDLEEGIKEMESRGIKMLMQYDSPSGRVRQAMFDHQNTFGIQVELSQFQGDNIFSESEDPQVVDF